MEYLHTRDSRNIYKSDVTNATALHYAIAFNNNTTVQWLLKHFNERKEDYDEECAKSSLTSKDSYGWSPISLAHYKSHLMMNEENVNNNNNNDDDIWHLIEQYCITYNIDCTDDISLSISISDMKQFKSYISKKEEFTVKYHLPLHYRRDMNTYKRHLLLILNSESGPGKAKYFWDNFVRKFWTHSQLLTFDTIHTKCMGHATEVCQHLNLNKYDGIVTFGGDGTVSEVFNGLYNHSDAKTALLIPITPIPCGSGNALCADMGYVKVLQAIRKVLYGLTVPIDCYVAKQKDENDTLGFISLIWAVMATIDFESEGYRWMGSLRFDAKAALEIMACKSYACRLYFKPVKHSPKYKFADKTLVIDNNASEIIDDEIEVKDDESLQLSIMQSKEDEDWWKKLECKWVGSVPDAEQKQESEEEKVEYPSDWKCVNDRFSMLGVSNSAFVSQTARFGGNDFSVHNNALRAIWSTQGTRVEYIRYMLLIDSGEHLFHHQVSYCDVTEAVIEPAQYGPPIDIDGERKPRKPTYIKLLPSFIQVTI